MREYELDATPFIGGWYIPDVICDNLIYLYHEDQHFRHDGSVTTKGKRNEKWKKSTEIYFYTSDKRYDAFTNYLKHLENVLEMYKSKYPNSDKVAPYRINQQVKIQHYKPGEGFYSWHCEDDGSIVENRARHLVFMTYLNTLDNAGTEFYHQNVTTPCHKGLTVIWPSHWTHMHRGVINHESDKYIITGWYSFNE